MKKKSHYIVLQTYYKTLLLTAWAEFNSQNSLSKANVKYTEGKIFEYTIMHLKNSVVCFVLDDPSISISVVTRLSAPSYCHNMFLPLKVLIYFFGGGGVMRGGREWEMKVLDVHSNGSFDILIFIGYLKLWIRTCFSRGMKFHISKHSEIDCN